MATPIEQAEAAVEAALMAAYDRAVLEIQTVGITLRVKQQHALMEDVMDKLANFVDVQSDTDAKLTALLEKAQEIEDFIFT